MKKITLLFLFALVSTWQINAQVLNQNAGWPNAAWTVTGTYNTNPLAFEADPTTTANFAFDDDDAGNPSDDAIAAESPAINLTPAVTAGETKVRVSVMYGYRFLAGDQLRFEYWDADATTWLAWGDNLAGNNTTVANDFCTITKTMFTTPDLDIATFTTTQLTGFKYRISYDDTVGATAWNWGFCFDAPTIISIPQPCLSGVNYPTGVLTIGVCDGFTSTPIANDSYAGDYFSVNVVAGQTYKFVSSIATDFFTISTDGDLTAAGAGTSPFSWVSTITGVANVHINTNITCGTEDVDRTTSVICGVPCLNGGLYPAATYTPAVCDGLTVNEINIDAWAGEFANVNTFANTPYTFGSSVATDYITIASADGTTVYTASVGTASYTPTADGVVRMYIHTDAACGVLEENRTRTVLCTASVAAPECAINPTPADGATGIEPIDPIVFSWEPSLTGGTPASYNFYGGVDPAALNFFANVTDPTYTIAVGQENLTIYWVAVPLNAAGEALGCIDTPWSATSGSLANTIFDNGTFAAVPNPVKDILNITFSQNIEKVQVMNLLGQEVMTKAINATQSQVDMSSLAQGTYLVKVTADGQVKTIKVIKE